MHVKITNGTPEKYTIGQLRRDNPNTSFPKTIPSDTLEQFGVFPLDVKPEPSFDSLTQYIETKPAELIDGSWVMGWEVKQLEFAAAAANVRKKRDRILEETVDRINPIRWEELPEPVKFAWSAYRQNLLDLPHQDGFPHDVVWPSKPE